MPVIRINKENYERLKEKAIEEDRPLSRIIARILTEALKPTPKSNPELHKKGTHADFAAMKQVFLDTWLKNNNFDYTDWSGVQAIALNGIIKKLQIINKNDASILSLFSVIMSRLPDFYKPHNLSSINKNLNGIIATIKNGGNKGNKIQDGGIYDHRN